MPPRVRLSKKPVTATHGSHESAEDIAEIMPEQHAVLAAAAIRKSGAVPATARAGIKKRAPNHAGKKVFIFHKPEAGSSSSWGREFCDRAFFRDGVASFVTEPFFGMGSRVL